jgi:hypothetical protein
MIRMSKTVMKIDVMIAFDPPIASLSMALFSVARLMATQYRDFPLLRQKPKKNINSLYLRREFRRIIVLFPKVQSIVAARHLTQNNSRTSQKISQPLQILRSILDTTSERKRIVYNCRRTRWAVSVPQ